MKMIPPHPLSACIGLSLVLMAHSACAEEQNSQNEQTAASIVQLDTIEVNARGVRETLQRAPLPITAISEQAIENRGLVDVRDIANLTPGFSFRSTFGRL